MLAAVVGAALPVLAGRGPGEPAAGLPGPAAPARPGMPGHAPTEQASGLVYPVDVVAAGPDALVVADFKAHGLLRVGLDGEVRPIALGEGLPRTPLYGARAVVDAPDGDGWIVADPATFGLYRVSADGTLSTVTTALDVPQGLVVLDDGALLVSDLRSGIGGVLRVGLDGGVSELAAVDSPKGIVADGEGGFVVVSHGARALFRVGRDGSVRPWVEGPPFEFPHDLVRLEDGSFVVTDGYARALFRVDAGGGVSELARDGLLRNPQGITRIGDTLYVADPGAGGILEVSAGGSVTMLAAVATPQPSPSASGRSRSAGRPARSQAVVQ